MKRGRKSSAELAIATLAIMTPSRPLPPADLGPETADAFREIVGPLPGDFFASEQAPLVAALARHVVSFRKLGEWTERMERPGKEDFELADYFKALEQRRKESGAMVAIMRSLRLTNQARYRPAAAGSKATAGAGAANLWEYDGGGLKECG